LLFDLAIDPLQHLLDIATQRGDLHCLRGQGPRVHTSLYADDAAIFIAPFKEDFVALASILEGFGEVTGLVTNVHKSIAVPIRCANLDLDDIMQSLQIQCANFPIKYLGLTLSHRRIKGIDVQPLIDKAASKLAPWHGKNIMVAGRCTLIKSVITSQAIFHIMPLALPPGTLQAFDKIERAFFWEAADKVSGGQCKVNWKIVCRPKDKGGLGILDLEKIARALRLRWPWLLWKDPSKAWIGSENPCNEADMKFFYAATIITIEDGRTANYWHKPWLQGRKPKDIAPLIFAISSRKSFMVREGLTNNFWIAKLNTNEISTSNHVVKFVELWSLIIEVQLVEGSNDGITCKLTNSGEYTAASAYNAQFEGMINSYMMKAVWKTWAPPKCKLFAWLVLQNRVWTADRLQR
jgi:hypothetical protein